MRPTIEPGVTRDRLHRRSREALSALAVQYLLGIGANLIGPPSEATGSGRVVASVVLGLHALVGIGVLVVAVRVWRAALAQRAAERTAVWALVILALTFLAGIGTMLTDNGWLSFLMAVGFVAAAGLYIRTYLEAGRPSRGVDTEAATGT
jgi:hypothetical protein